MIWKFYIYVLSGGLSEVIHNVLIQIKKKFYYKSETVFLYLIKNDFQPTTILNLSDINFNVILNENELEKIDFKRIMVLNYKKWFAGESQSIIGFSKNRPVSFTWSHYSQYSIHGIFIIDLFNDKSWIGPTFVDKTMRGKGINKAQIQFQICNAPENINYFLTSANSKNIASIKSFENLGFKIGLKIVKSYGSFSKKRTKMEFYHLGHSIIKIM